MLKKNLSSLLEKTLPLKIESFLTATCPITGITILMQVPAIPSISLTYTNPLALSSNFLPLSLLPLKELLVIDRPILAGMLLATMKHRELLSEETESSLTSVEQNILLQSLSSLYLIELIKFYAPITRKQSLLLPRLSLQEKDAEEKQLSNIKHLLTNYTKVCKNILYPPYSPEEEEVSSLTARAEKLIQIKLSNKDIQLRNAIKEANKSKLTLQIELISRGRKIAKDLQTNSNLSDKLLHFIKVLFQGETILTIEASVKERIVTALRKHEGDALALELSNIIMNKIMTNEKESIFPSVEVKEEQEEVIEVLQTVEVEQKKLSLKERILLIKERKGE